MDTKRNKTQVKITTYKTPKWPHSETDSDNYLDQTFFPEFIVLESTKDTPITKLSPFIIEETLGSMIKPRSMKKQAKNILLV